MYQQRHNRSVRRLGILHSRLVISQPVPPTPSQEWRHVVDCTRNIVPLNGRVLVGEELQLTHRTRDCIEFSLENLELISNVNCPNWDDVCGLDIVRKLEDVTVLTLHFATYFRMKQSCYPINWIGKNVCLFGSIFRALSVDEYSVPFMRQEYAGGEVSVNGFKLDRNRWMGAPAAILNI